MSIRLFVGFVAFGLGACASSDEKGGGGPQDSDTPIETPHGDPDEDLDGFTAADGDCDDQNGGVFPGATETCDGLDNDCNDQIDDGIMRQFYVDHDGDGFGDADAIVEDCKQSEGLVLVAGDCNDRDESVHPDAGELCDAANVDEDCDGLFGADDPDVQDARVFYADSDGDAYGLAGSTPTIACDQPAGTVTNAYDCDDDNALVNPSQLEVCDGASLDDDCDGMVDDADPESLKTDYWPDVDEDTFGDERIAATHTCFDLTSSGYVLNGEDCDDQVTAVNPDAVELCGPDHVDDDCDGRIDEADSDTDTHNWYVDGDADGYGEDGSTPVVTCQIIPGSATRAGDCDDADPTLNPGVDELCNASDIDEDCDGKVDELDPETPPTDYYIDTDGDGYGASSTLYVTCDDVVGYVTLGGDCDEGNTAVSPEAFDDCEDGVDNDCDGTIDNCHIDPLSMLDAEAIIVGDYYTYSSNRVVNVGDLNGDGNGDVAISTYNSGTYYYGKSSIVFGPVVGSTTLSSADVDLTGTYSYEYFSYEVAGGSDTNGDGAADMIVGGQYNNIAYVFYGPITADRSGTAADATITGVGLYDYIGKVVALSPDFDGDGLGETIAAAPYADRSGGYTDAGIYYLWSGPLSGSVSASTADYQLGGTGAYDDLGYTDTLQKVDVGDMDGDGLEELALANPWKDVSAGGSFYYDAGQVFVVYGGSLTAGSYDAAAAAGGSVIAESYSQWLGWSVAETADYNGDGHADLIASAPQGGSVNSYSGLTYVFEGPISGTIATSGYVARFEGESYENSGRYGIAAGDFNGDGKSDIMVDTGPYHSTDTCYSCGGAYLAIGGIEGAQLLTETFTTLTGPSSYSTSGVSVAFIDDWDGDGKDEVALTQTNDWSYYSGAGSTSIFSGDGLYP